MSRRLSPEEMITRIQHLMDISRYRFANGWFFPSDLVPFSNSLKYQCKKLYGLGLLERNGDASARWGYSYKIKSSRK